MLNRRVATISLALVSMSSALAGELSTSGYIGAEVRVFTESPQYTGQSDDTQLSAVFQPELRYKSENSTVTFIPFYRDDSIDEERSHFDVRELHWRWVASDWELLAGVNRIFWGVIESRHLVDIINQIDLVEDIDGEDKLGQPMLNYTHLNDWGTVSIFILPGFRERTFAGPDGRLRSAIVVDADAAVYESSDKDDHIDVALRYTHFIGDWDIGLSYFNGTSREPRFILNNTASRFLPVYDLINQFGMDLQYTSDAWLWKLEAMAREGQGNTFSAVSAGFEYTLYQIMQSDKDLGLLLEYHYDGRDATAAPSTFDHDIFVGARLAFNDTQDTELLAGITVDSSGDDRFVNIEAERRFTDHIKGELRVRLFNHPESGSSFAAFEKDDYVQLQLRYYF